MTYGLLMVDRFEFILHSRGQRKITGVGRKETNRVTKEPLAKMRAAFSSLIDEEGHHVVQYDERDKLLDDQLALAKQAAQEFREALPRLGAALKWAEGRIEVVTQELSHMLVNVERARLPVK